MHTHHADVAKRDLTPYPKTRAAVVGVSHLHPESVLVGMNDRDAKWHDLYRVDLASGKRTLIEKNDYRYDRADGGKLTRLFSSRPALEGKPLVPQWPQEIKSRDGKTLVSYLSLPKSGDANNDGKADKPLPMVLLVHGGPWARDNYGYSGWNQWLANRGYAVLQVNYRGSTGFGKQFVNASESKWAGKMHDDLIDAVDWAVKQGTTTKDNVAIMGGSYGGYATLGMTFTPDEFKCGVDIVGPSNLVTLLNTFPAYWASFMEQWYRRVGDPCTEAGKQLLLDRSPITHVESIKKPLLIAQGANAPRVIQAESDQIVDAMKTKSMPVTYVLFPDEGHGFARPENSKAFNAVAEGFLGTCLGGCSRSGRTSRGPASPCRPAWRVWLGWPRR